MIKKHLAIFSKEAINKLFSGEKTVEVRLSQKRIPPFGLVGIGDLIFIKPPGEEIKGQFIVKKVISIEGIDVSDWKTIENFLKDKKFLSAHKKAVFATIIFMDKVEQFITSPIKIPKKDLRGWVVL
ncbi:hypothetical protein HYS97_02825 [Candidatus Daviesbacteria bacterium]|nr:hypothetical protein [Candidatus Daviesbacteria bacterium]